ncbi:Flp family type IVb pilin [Tsuneonella amylolytica]|uniref:Flp family type IVb pilin n=1 Tax=Tsuneonella amylolytica TaxID=2338327 RepID=UPI002D789B69|nr:Flp family type IVb pilin [Tsuneonella amylolytica]
MAFIKKFIVDESGASAAEYALIIAIVGVGIGAAALALGNNVTAAIGGAATDVHNCNVDKPAGASAPYNPATDCASFGAGSGGGDAGGEG